LTSVISFPIKQKRNLPILHTNPHTKFVFQGDAKRRKILKHSPFSFNERPNLAETKPVRPRKREMGAERCVPLDVRRMDGQDENPWDVGMDR
jgi:hypothetical protein